MIKKLEFDRQYYKNRIQEDYDNFKRYSMGQTKSYEPFDPIRYPALEKDAVQPTKSWKNVRLSPLLNGKECGEELVPVIYEKRTPIKVPLGSTDVTRGAPSP